MKKKVIKSGLTTLIQPTLLNQGKMSKLKEIQPTFDTLSKNVRKLKLVGGRLKIGKKVSDYFKFESRKLLYSNWNLVYSRWKSLSV